MKYEAKFNSLDFSSIIVRIKRVIVNNNQNVPREVF